MSTLDVLLGELYFVLRLFRNLEISMHIINKARPSLPFLEA